MSTSDRDLHIRQKFRLSRFLVEWEMILLYLLLLTVTAMAVLRPHLFFTPGTVQSIIRSGMDLSFMVLGMTFVLLLGEIDVSVGAIMIASSAVMGALYEAGLPDIAAMLGGIVTGGLCGVFNGWLIARLKMPSVIVTIATSLLFRGILQIVLGVNTLKVFPAWFSRLAWRDLGGIIPYSTLAFLVMAVLFTVLLHRTRFGRELYIIGNSEAVAVCSGIRTVRVKMTAFTLLGVMASLSGILFVGRLGGVSSGMGTGYELRVIAIAVLGGVSTGGGKGKMIGPVIAVFIMAFLCKSLDLLEVHANVQRIIIGVILLLSVTIPSVKNLWSKRRKAK